MIKISNEEARRFLLNKQGLLGKPVFSGKAGVLEYIRRVGSIQFDPVDVCGINPELILQSRVQGFKKQILNELLYQDRQLIDFFDKNLCIFPVEDWPMFRRRNTDFNSARGHEQKIEQIKPLIQSKIETQGYAFAKDFRQSESQNIIWDWGVETSVARAALESMYEQSELIIHHKLGRQKAYAFAKDHLDKALFEAESPFKNNEDYQKQMLLRRIGAIGLLWNKPSDAWLGIKQFKAFERNRAFQALLEEGEIIEVQVEKLENPFYMKTSDQIFLTEKKENTQRMEFLAPLDCLLWDRNLISTLFDFDYKWEIYTPKIKRKYGAYVLPVLFGTHLIGRVEIERKTKEKILLVKHFWLEEGVVFTSEIENAFSTCVERFKSFNACEKVVCVDKLEI